MLVGIDPSLLCRLLVNGTLSKRIGKLETLVMQLTGSGKGVTAKQFITRSELNATCSRMKKEVSQKMLMTQQSMTESVAAAQSIKNSDEDALDETLRKMLASEMSR